MSERLVHQRTKGPASTPAARLVELQNELSHTQRLLTEAEARADRLQADYDIYHRVGDVSFGGIEVAQWRCDFWMWEYVLNDNSQLKAIFELGTWLGGFSWWLAGQCRARDMHFETYDMTRPQFRPPPMFIRLDVFADREFIGETIRGYEPCVVFCDNGNKPREMAEYSQEIRSPESLLVVHDWGTEFMPDDVPDNLTMVYGDFCESLGSLSRVFRLKESNA